MGKLRILFDANSMVMRTGRTHLSGIGRTAIELARAFDSLKDDSLAIRLMTQTFRGYIPGLFDRLPVLNVPWPIGPHYDWLIKGLPILETISPYDLFYEPSNYAPLHKPEKTVVTIHDAMFFSHPESIHGHDYARRMVPEFAKKVRAIATPSVASKNDIIEYMSIPEDKIKVIPWGVDRNIFHAGDKAGARRRVFNLTGASRPYFIAVSNSVGRKNTLSVLRAFKVALSNGCQHDLLLVWGNPPAEYISEFSSEIQSERIRFLKHVDDGILGDLYAGATASWFPSRYEGFGLPILESMACGTPVITCKNSALVEVGGDAAIYVGPDDLDDMVEIMRTLDKDGCPGESHGQLSCLKQADRFSWDATVRSYRDFFHKWS